MMRRGWFIASFAAFFTASMVCAATPKSLVRFDGLSRKSVAEIGMAGYDVAKAGPTFAEVVVNAQELKALTRKAASVKTLIPDLDAYISSILKKQKKGVEYYTYDRMVSTMRGWAEKYSSIARLESIGKTCEGRDIWAMKVSDNPALDEKEPAVLVMGAHHAREWISVEVPMAALQKYLENYGKDEALTRLVNEREVWFVPMVNADGVTFSQNKSKYWRKNRRDNGNNVFGVDLNRNYGYKWGNVGASDSPSSDTYHGKGPFSEPESQAIKALYEREHFQAAVSFHSYSELILYPFGYGYNIPCPDEPTLKKLAAEMAVFNKYTPENSADLYPAMGDTDDWGYGDQKALAFTFELAKTFIPSPAEIAGINNANVPAVMHLIDKAGTYAITTPTGNEELAAYLDLNDSLQAIADGNEILSASTRESAKLAVSDKLLQVGKRVAELVANDMLNGSGTALEKLSAARGAGYVMPLLRARINFEIGHGAKIDGDLLRRLEAVR